MKPTRLISLCLSALFLICVAASFSQASENPYISNHGINFSTGNKYLHQNDISLSGPVASLSFSRNYNSQSVENSVIGFGWSFSWNEKLTFETALGLAIYNRADGRMIHFTYNGTDAWINDVGKKAVITATEDAPGYTMTQPNGTRLFFDIDGRLIEKSDLNNNSTFLAYDGDNLTTISDGFGRSVILTYNAGGKLDSITTPIGTCSYTYDANDNLVSMTRPDNTSRTYLYEDPNDVHNLTGVIDETSTRILTIAYDLMDRVISSELTDGNKAVTIEYQPGYKRVITDSLGVPTAYQLEVLHGVAQVKSFEGPGCSSCASDSGSAYTYDFRQQVTEMTDGRGTITAYTYDDRGNKLTETKAGGTPEEYTTTYTYDTSLNKAETITIPSIANPGQNRVTSMSYDAAGNMLTRTESGFTGSTAITMTTTYAYDSYGRVTSMNGPRTDVNDVITMSYYPNEADQGSNRGFLHTVTNALGHVVTYSSYNGFGQAEQITDANGLTTSLACNTQGLVVTRTTGDLTTSYVYDSTGTLQSVSLPGARIISYQYNTAGQVASITDSQGNSIAYTYDSEGRRTGEEVRDPENTLTRFAGFRYDARGNLEQVTLPGNTVQTAEYDLVGNLVKTVNATGMQTDSTYDALGRLLTLTEAGVVAGSYTYDGHNNVSQVQDADNKATRFVYDDFGRRTLATAPDTGATASSYDAAGNLLAVTDAKGQTMNMTYDGLNRPVSKGYAGGDILFAYDQGDHGAGRLSRITDSEGTASFAYDAAGRIVSETRVIGPTTHTIGYNWDAATGEPSGMTYPSGLGVSYSRDTGGQISGINLNGTPLVTNISHLPFGPLKTATLDSTNLTRSYDQRYNVTGIKAGSLDYTYSRDNGGHVTGITGIPLPTTGDTSITSSYNPANNQLTTAPPKSYSYDATGNMVSDGTATFTWDGLNRLIKVEKAGATVAEYGYDAANRRIRKTVGATTTHYLYDLNNQLIAETLANGTVLREYIYLDGEPLALKEYQTNPGTYYFINDHLDTPQQLVTTSGAIVWQAAYLPFGQAQIKTATVANNLRFPGQYFDAETGLHYNWNRFYDPDSGRYVSADPIGLKGGMNLYLYVSGNPVNWIDPTGKFIDELVGIGVISTAATIYLVGESVAYGEEINNRINNAWTLWNKEYKKNCPDSEYAQALLDYIDALEKKKRINLWQTIELATGLVEPYSNLPSLPPTPPVKPPLPMLPQR